MHVPLFSVSPPISQTLNHSNYHWSIMVKYITGDVRFPAAGINIQSFHDLPQELAAIIKSDQIPLKHYLVIDVRDDDYAGGNILKVQNWPSRRFERKVHELVENTKDINTVIFHCSFSQERLVESPFNPCWITGDISMARGPKAARVSICQHHDDLLSASL